jgi:hypothetical protein
MILLSASVKLPNGSIAPATLHHLPALYHPLRFAWFFDGIYRAGFATHPEAENWGKKEGLIP